MWYKMLKICLLCTISYGIANSKEKTRYACPISGSTVELVENCPDNKDKWKEAAARKNCTAYADQCDEPERLVYHCVINSYVNQTLEVCAYAQNILYGHCSEYNKGGNLIQANMQTNCMTFANKPCPNFYRSGEAYKYPDCYDLTKNLNTVTPELTSSKHPAKISYSTGNVTLKLADGRIDLEKRIVIMYMPLLTVLLIHLY